MHSEDHIVIRGLRQNNLKNVSLDIPKGKIVVFTGVSGSGKSSIVFDTIAAESQRQMNETYTAFVIVSGYDDFSYCREALRLQITDYILKPVNYEEFGTCIDNLKIALFQRKAAGQNNPQEEWIIHSITRYLQEHLAQEVSLSVLAEEFHLNAQYISQLFKSEIGVNFLAYLTNIRMEQAKKLLLTTALSIAEVSEQSGYADYRVFTKAFKKSEGNTPSQYRRDFLEKNME